MTKEQYYNVDYALELEDGSSITYRVEIDQDTVISRLDSEAPYPEWTRLERGKCNECKLKDSEYCPIAIRLVEPIKRFSGLLSYASATTTVKTPERDYMKKCDVQDALRSLFGLIMATSGCPSMQPFKYMARYHLPFSSVKETISRIVSTYLMRQLFKHNEPKEIAVNMKEIEALYNTMRTLNEGIVHRLKGATKGDGAVNAIVILGAYSSLIPTVIKDEIRKLKPLFE